MRKEIDHHVSAICVYDFVRRHNFEEHVFYLFSRGRVIFLRINPLVSKIRIEQLAIYSTESVYCEQLSRV